MRKIRAGKKIRNLYVVVLPLMRDGILEIYVYNQLLQPFYLAMHDKVHIVGIAMDKGNAEDLVLQMVQDMYDACGGESFDTELFFRGA